MLAATTYQDWPPRATLAVALSKVSRQQQSHYKHYEDWQTSKRKPRQKDSQALRTVMTSR